MECLEFVSILKYANYHINNLMITCSGLSPGYLKNVSRMDQNQLGRSAVQWLLILLGLCKRNS